MKTNGMYIPFDRYWCQLHSLSAIEPQLHDPSRRHSRLESDHSVENIQQNTGHGTWCEVRMVHELCCGLGFYTAVMWWYCGYIIGPVKVCSQVQRSLSCLLATVVEYSPLLKVWIRTVAVITLFWWLTLAPASNSLRTVSVCPFWAAIPRGTLHVSWWVKTETETKYLST